MALWSCFGISAAGALLGVSLYVLGRARPQRPMLERWQEGHGPALDSPPLLAGIRGDSTERALAEWLTRASTVTAARSRPSS